MNRCTKRLFTLLLSLFTAGIAMRSSTSATYVFNVENRDPFGVLNLTKLIIKGNTNSTGIILDWWDYTIKIDPNHEAEEWWKIRVYEICDEYGYNCKKVSSLWDWEPWNWISADWYTWDYCYLDDDWNLMCDNSKLGAAITAIITEMGLNRPKDGILTITQWSKSRTFSANTGNNVTVDLSSGWPEGGVTVNTTGANTWYYCSSTNWETLECNNIATSSDISITPGISPEYYCSSTDWESLQCNNEIKNWNSEWEKIEIPMIWTDNKMNILHPKQTAYNVWIWIDENSLKNWAPNHKLRVNWTGELDGNTIINPSNNDEYKNMPEVVINTYGVKMFWGINFYRTLTDQKKMRWLSVNWPILAWRSGNYIYMYANWDSTWDLERSYEILWNNELAVGTRAWAFLYFWQRKKSYNNVITGWNLTWTSGVGTAVASVAFCVRGTCNQANNVSVQSWHPRHHVNPDPIHVDSDDAYKSLMIGVNTDTPNATLDVNGSLRVWSNCAPIGLTCDENNEWTMMYLVKKQYYKWSLVICIADGVTSTTQPKVDYVRYDIMEWTKWKSLTEDLWFQEDDWSCALPKPSYAVYPAAIEK